MGNNYISLIYQVYIYIAFVRGFYNLFTRTRIIHRADVLDFQMLPVGVLSCLSSCITASFCEETHTYRALNESFFQTTWRDHFLSHIMVTSGANSVLFPVSRMKKNNRCLSLKSLRPYTKLTELNISPKRRKPGFLSEKTRKRLCFDDD